MKLDIKKLIDIANSLDLKGLHKEANVIDNVIKEASDSRMGITEWVRMTPGWKEAEQKLTELQMYVRKLREEVNVSRFDSDDPMNLVEDMYSGVMNALVSVRTRMMEDAINARKMKEEIEKEEEDYWNSLEE